MAGVLKWVGSKARLMPTLLRHVPSHGALLIEPFCGSCSLLMSTRYDRYLLNDANPDLIAMFKALQAAPDAFIADAKSIFVPNNNNEAAFSAFAAEFNATTDSWRRAVLFLYLVRHCFNGVYRVNRSGGFNVSFGEYQRVSLPLKSLVELAERLEGSNVVFSNLDYKDFLAANVSEQGVLYLDPPYIPTSKTASFVGYTKTPFTMIDHRQLHYWAKLYADQGHKVILSNSDSELTRKIFKGKQIESVTVGRSVSCKANGRLNIQELIVIY